MTRTTRIARLGAFTLAAIAALEVLPHVASAGQFTIVRETFDGYSSFPDQKPDGDPVNLGVPLVSEGADSGLWLAARFEYFDDDPLSEDVGVQKFAGGGNSTHVGRVGDDAGLVLRLDLRGFTDVTLDFDWRTFQAESPDRFVVAYYQGDGTAFQPEGLGAPGGEYDWFNDPELGAGLMDLDDGTTNSWYANNWSELLRASSSDSFHHAHYDLPGDDVLYLAFWLDNGDMDFGKFDNVLVMANPIEITVPEPSTWSLLLVGAAGMFGLFRRRG